MEVIVNLVFALGAIVVASITGRILERRHFKRIDMRERALRKIPLLSGKRFPQDRRVFEARLVQGSVVISIDYFKRLLASLRMIFGGELNAYCSLLDRARRESILRMKECFPDADMIINFRMETSSISKGGRNALGSTEVLAYGTAIKFSDASDQPAVDENR